MPPRCWRCDAGPAMPTSWFAPELQLTGYPPEDLVLKPEFVRRDRWSMQNGWSSATVDPGPAMLFGDDRRPRAAVTTTPSLLADAGRSDRPNLEARAPNYGTFDEKRVFSSGPRPRAAGVSRRPRRRSDLRGHLAGSGVRSPGRSRRRASACSQRQPLRARQGRSSPAPRPFPRAIQTGLPDRLSQPRRRPGRAGVRRFVASSCMPTASWSSRWPTGRSSCSLRDWERGAGGWACLTRARPRARPAIRPTSTTRWCIALRDYVTRNGFPGVILGPVRRHRQRPVRGRRCRRARARTRSGA